MSVCGQTEEESGSEEPVGGAGAPIRDMYEQKAVSKVVRVLTVLAYLLSVSLAAILLSVYYVCVWQSPKLPPAINNTGDEGRADKLHASAPHGYNASLNDISPQTTQSGGGNSTVSDAVTSPPPELTSLPADSEPPDLPLFTFNGTLEDLSANLTTPNVTLNATDQR